MNPLSLRERARERGSVQGFSRLQSNSLSPTLPLRGRGSRIGYPLCKKKNLLSLREREFVMQQ